MTEIDDKFIQAACNLATSLRNFLLMGSIDSVDIDNGKYNFSLNFCAVLGVLHH